MGYGAGPYGAGGYGTGLLEGGTTVRVFEPPTHEEAIRTNVRPLNRYRLTYANSIVRVGGFFQSIRTPSDLVLAGLVEGVDYFMGGHVYEVSDETAVELTAAGYTVRTVTTED